MDRSSARTICGSQGVVDGCRHGAAIRHRAPERADVADLQIASRDVGVDQRLAPQLESETARLIQDHVIVAARFHRCVLAALRVQSQAESRERHNDCELHGVGSRIGLADQCGSLVVTESSYAGVIVAPLSILRGLDNCRENTYGKRGISRLYERMRKPSFR